MVFIVTASPQPWLLEFNDLNPKSESETRNREMAIMVGLHSLNLDWKLLESWLNKKKSRQTQSLNFDWKLTEFII